MKKLILLLALFSANIFAAPVNINTADAEKIAESLKGIGLKKAKAIVDFRKKNGPFKTTDDLKQVKGIGEKTVVKNKKDILLTKSKKTPIKKTVNKKITPKKPISKKTTSKPNNQSKK